MALIQLSNDIFYFWKNPVTLGLYFGALQYINIDRESTGVLSMKSKTLITEYCQLGSRKCNSAFYKKKLALLSFIEFKHFKKYLFAEKGFGKSMDVNERSILFV